MRKISGTAFLGAIVFAILAGVWALTSGNYDPVTPAGIMAGILVLVGFMIVLIAYGVAWERPGIARQALRNLIEALQRKRYPRSCPERRSRGFWPIFAGRVPVIRTPTWPFPPAAVLSTPSKLPPCALTVQLRHEGYDMRQQDASLAIIRCALRFERIVANADVATTTYSYDANGNLIQAGGWNYVWDYLNRMLASRLTTTPRRRTPTIHPAPACCKPQRPPRPTTPTSSTH